MTDSVHITEPMAQGFTSHPVVEHYAGTNKARLAASLCYVDKYGRLWTAERGMPTDGGTIWHLPRSAWWVTGSPYGRYLAAFIIHDAECYRAVEASAANGWQIRLDADRLLREMLIHLGASRLTASTIYAGVRVGSAFA